MQIFRKIFSLVFAGSTAVILLITPLLYYAFNMGFYTTQVENQNPEIVQDVYDFLKGGDPLNSLFTDNEKSHMQDVKEMFRVIFLTEIVAFILFIFLLLFYILNKQKSDIILGLLFSSGVVLFFIVLLFSLLIIDFETIFITFHKIFFPQGNWAFASSSMLIKMFPLYFFEEIVLRIVIFCLGFSCLVFGSNLYLRKKV